MLKTPVELLLQYRYEVYKASSGNTPRDCFDLLCSEYPAFNEISFNSFRAYLRLFVAFYEFYETQLVAAELHSCSSQNSSGHVPEKKGLEKGASLAASNVNSQRSSINIAGWTVNQSKTDYFYRGTRTVKGRGRSVYLGKIYEPDFFLEKLQRKNKEYGLPDTSPVRKSAADKCKIHLKRKSYSLPEIRSLCRQFTDDGTGYPTFSLQGFCSWAGLADHPEWFDLTRADLDKLVLEGTLVPLGEDAGFYVPVGVCQE